MSSTKAALLFMAASAGPCSGSDPEPTPAPAYSYGCAQAFDTDCRYQASVEVTGGTLVAATMMSMPDLSTYISGDFTDVVGSVTLTDTLGEAPAVTCDFAVDFSIDTLRENGRAEVAVQRSVVMDAACPLTCAWFLPASGDYDAGAGKFQVSLFEGQWDLEFGASAPGEPEYGPLWLYTSISSVSFGSGGVTLTEPAAVTGGSWTVPMTPPSNSTPATVCDF